MRTIAVANQKGGVGKTTTAFNLATGLKYCGYNVLFVDLDPQCNSTSSYKAQIENTNTLYDLMDGYCDIKDAIQHTEVGDIIAGDPCLADFASKFQSVLGGYFLIRNALEKVKDDYDFCIIDTAPSLGVYLINALCAADGVIIPIKAEKYSVDGLEKLVKTINDTIQNGNPKLKVYGVVLTAYDKRNKLDREIKDQLPEIGKMYNFNVFNTVIRTCQTIKDSQAMGESLFVLDAKCNGAVDYANLIKEIL